MKNYLYPDSEYDSEKEEYVKFYRKTDSFVKYISESFLYYLPGVIWCVIQAILPAVIFEIGIIIYWLFLLGMMSWEDMHLACWNIVSIPLMLILTIYVFIKQFKEL